MSTRRDSEDPHLRLVREIGHMVNQRRGLDTILASVVRSVAAALHLDVVSVYLREAGGQDLVIRSTVGLTVDPAAPIRLAPGEGLTGEVYQTRRPLTATPASEHPHYKYFPDSREERYDSYIGVPILLQGNCLGVLVGQNSRSRPINPAEETLFEIVASRLAGLLEVADRLERLREPVGDRPHQRAFQGKAISGGFAVGQAFVLRGLFQSALSDSAPAVQPEQEGQALEQAMRRTREDLLELVETLRQDQRLPASEINIFRSHLMILEDRTFADAIARRIGPGVSSRRAVIEGVEQMAQQFERHEDPYIRERAQDLRDIGDKILHHLGGTKRPAMELPQRCVLVAHEVGPTFLAAVQAGQVAALVCERGGETSHTAILARSLGIPAVTGIDEACRQVSPGQTLLVDGHTGFVFANPTPALVREYQAAHDRRSALCEAIQAEPESGPARAGLNVALTANIGYPGDVPLARKYGLNDVGLFRTEFAFMQHDDWPGVERQKAIYQDVARSFPGQVTLRTLDIGGDKVLPYFRFPHEDNPLLGLRSIRFSMEHLDLFREQVRAILLARASGARLRVVLPMVSNVWEVEAAREVLHQQAREIGLDDARLPPLGIMAEVPAITCQLDDFKDLADFISVGTNDLVQYLLAVDRGSNTVAHLYSSFHPSVLRTLHEICIASRELKKEVTVCGEMAGVPAGALALMAIGYTRFSVLPARAPLLRHLAGRLEPRALEQLRRALLGEKKEAEIRHLLQDAIAELDPALARVADHL